MEDIMSNAWTILLIGMITVSVILGLVVLAGNLLIRLTNKFWPLPQNHNKKGDTPGVLPSGALPSGTVAAIVAAVETVTGGTGKVTGIEKSK